MNENIIKETETLMGQKAYEIINLVIDTAEPRLLADYRENVSLFAPKYFIKYLQKYFENSYQIAGQKETSQMTFRGYEIRLHPYNEVVLAHLDYAMYLNEQLINKIKI